MRWGVALTSSDIILKKMTERRGGGGWKTSQWNLIKLRNKALLTCLLCLIFATCALLRLFNATHSRKTAKLTTRCVVEIRFKVKSTAVVVVVEAFEWQKAAAIHIHAKIESHEHAGGGKSKLERREEKRDIKRRNETSWAAAKRVMQMTFSVTCAAAAGLGLSLLSSAYIHTLRCYDYARNHCTAAAAPRRLSRRVFVKLHANGILIWI